MSSRAVRKALKQREIEEAQAKLASLGPGSTEKRDKDDDNNKEEDEEEEEEEDARPIQKPKPNLFAMLGGDDDDDEEEEDEDDEPSAKSTAPAAAPPPSATPKSKKKKNKKKNKKKSASAPPPEDEDEIDRALRQLDIKKPSAPSTSSPQPNTQSANKNNSSDTDLLTLLKIDSRNLDASQEMRRLFGRAAMAGNDAPEEAAGGNPRGRRGGRGGMVPGAQQAGRGMLLKKNILAQAKANWPNAGSGGLGMVIVKDGEGKDGCEFKFVHGVAYQDVQRQFMMCVMSMDPNRMVALLQHNPYHISTLLQVSEIFSHQRDYTTSGDLLERALFGFGRSLHSTFPSLLTNPSISPSSSAITSPSFDTIKHPRLNFSYFPNREFYLTIWRYIHNLTLRGTFRTASEFSRLLFLLSPHRDPYAMLLYLPILFLKAHQPHLVIALANSPTLRPQTKDLPGIAYSISLAYLQLENEIAAREYLAKAITKFPWVASRLWQALDLDSGKLPAALWGRLPPEDSPVYAIVMEIYVERARDLWSNPEAVRVLMETINSIHHIPTTKNIKPALDVHCGHDVVEGVPANIARHVLLSDIPAVTTLLPLGWKNRTTTGYDPLPPVHDIVEYDMLSGVAGLDAPLDASATAAGIGSGHQHGEVGATSSLLGLVGMLLSWSRAPPEPEDEQDLPTGDDAAPPENGQGLPTGGTGDDAAPPENVQGLPTGGTGHGHGGHNGGRYIPNWPLLNHLLGPESTERLRGVIAAREQDMGRREGGDTRIRPPSNGEEEMFLEGVARTVFFEELRRNRVRMPQVVEVVQAGDEEGGDDDGGGEEEWETWPVGGVQGGEEEWSRDDDGGGAEWEAWPVGSGGEVGEQ